ncbi:MAG: hypothetical protein RIS31_100 [Actinomycetota bacterium]|jgi:phenylpropionate dioxygenase-like ring-hydroxylating dioxygenase large terminal subunit
MPIDYFVDETFNAPANAGKRPFYALAVVGVDRADLKQLRLELGQMFAGQRWHSSEILSRKFGRNRFMNLASQVGMKLNLKIFLVYPISIADRTGERSRKALLKAVAQEVAKKSPQSFITFERRSGGLHSRDVETLAEIAADGFRHCRLWSPADERLLWLPDTLATAYRHLFLYQDRTLIESFQQEVIIRKISSKVV